MLYELLLPFSINGHHDLASVVRSSAYFNRPPPLPLLCAEIDGNQTNTPIIFEDIYKDEATGISFMPCTCTVILYKLSSNFDL